MNKEKRPLRRVSLAQVLTPKFLSTPNLALDVALLGGAILVGFLGSYSIYQTGWLYGNAAAGVLLGAAFVAIVRWRKIPGPLAAGAWLITYIVVGSVLVGPGNESSFGAIVGRVAGVASAPITGWKNILSLKIPLGTYHEVLAPIFFLAFASATAAFYFAWKGKGWVGAAAMPFIPLLFGIIFGSPDPSPALPNMSANVAGWVLGLTTTTMAFAWLVWRPLAWKAKARTDVLDAHGKEVKGRALTSKVTRWAMGAGMVVLAIGVSAALTPWMTAGKTRDVLRSHVDPVLTVSAQVSPLSTLRQYYGDDLFDVEMLRFEADAPTPRIRLATMSTYDGNSYNVTDQDEDARYARVPSKVKRDVGDQEKVWVDVEILAYEGVWVPLPGSLISIRFQGEDREALADGFFYSADADTGVEVANPGLREGVEYKVEADGPETGSIAGFEPASDLSGTALAPESLVTWIDAQEVPRNGAGLQMIVERMRERGYLSHGLVTGEKDQPKWASALTEYTFAPSRSGHSLDRLDRMFTKLNEQEEAAGEDPKKELLVAMVGDDEQFAVAAALAAQHFGFDSRVAIGFRTQPVPGDKTLSYCEGGVCTGGDLTAWVEVQDGVTGEWVPLDVTPQYEMTPAPKIERQSDPKHHTTVEPKRVETLPPPQADPQTTDTQVEVEEEDSGFKLGESTAFRVAALVWLSLFVLVLPFATILGVKWIRTLRRRRATPLASQIVGAWENYVDAAVDAGKPPPPRATRLEIAEACSPGDIYAKALAQNADYATFSARGPEGYDSGAVWEASKTATANLVAGETASKRWRAKLSLRSLVPHGRQTGLVARGES